MFVKTHSLQHAPAIAHGGRINNQVNGEMWGVQDSTLQNISAALSPFVVIFLPSKSPGTVK